jgi:GNAT superfamily N-acetyltransferase
MFGNISLFIQLIYTSIAEKELQHLIRERVYFKRVVVPVTLDLTSLNGQQNPFQNTDYQFVELNSEELQANKRTFSIRSRYLKALRSINNGLRGFVLLKDGKVISDIWCVAPLGADTPIKHPDLDMLGITCAGGDSYAEFIYIDPAYRGKKLAVPIFLSLLLTLKREGWRRIFAYYYEDNISSKWMHWMLKFEELPKLCLSRFFFFKKTQKFIPTNPSIERNHS